MKSSLGTRLCHDMAHYLKVGVAVSCVLKVESACGGEVEGDGPKQHPLLPEAAGGLPKLGRRKNEREWKWKWNKKKRIGRVGGAVLTGGLPKLGRRFVITFTAVKDWRWGI